MKIILLSGASYSLPVMNFLHGQQMLEGVVSVGKQNKHNMQVEYAAGALQLPFKRFFKTDLLTVFKNWLTEMAPDIVLVYGCRYKLPVELFDIPKFGFYNVHFSLLPAYRGQVPVFWQLKHGKSVGGITVHRMAEDFDTGPILIQKEIAVFPGETYGLYSSRLSGESVAVIAIGIGQLKEGTTAIYPQAEVNISQAPAPTAADLMIDWESFSAKEIENLVNAANPDFQGAVTSLRGQPFRLLEVGPAELSNPTAFMPGTIVLSDVNHGLFVACSNAQYLRINVGALTEGIFSGQKLAGMGIAAGERFESASSLISATVKR